MYLALLNLVLLLSLHAIAGEEDEEYEITDCDRDLAGILCAEFKNDCAACAELMPADEQKFFYECAADLKLSSKEDWIGLLGDVCAGEDPAQISWDFICCWNDKMNATIDQMTDDKVYPYAHFECKANLFMQALEKTSCVCQLEKGSSCIKMPTVPAFG